MIRLSSECSLAQQVWAEAKTQNTFKSFLPNLRTVLSLKREEAQYLGFESTPYNALLDVLRAGIDSRRVAAALCTAEDRARPLTEEFNRAPSRSTTAFCTMPMTRPGRWNSAGLVLIAMGYDFEKGRLDLSAHPFTTSFHPTDVRVTTRVYETRSALVPF